MWFADESGFYFHTGEAHFWTMADNLMEDKVEIVAF